MTIPQQENASQHQSLSAGKFPKGLLLLEFPVGPLTFILSEFLASYFVKRFSCWVFLYFWYFSVWNPFLLLQRSPSWQLNVTENSSGGPSSELGAYSGEDKHMWEPFQLCSSSLQVRLWSHLCSFLLSMAGPQGKNQASDLWNPETIKMVTATHREERSWGSIFSTRFIFLYFATISHLWCSWVNTEIRAAGSRGPSTPKNHKMKKISFLSSQSSKCCVRKSWQEKLRRQDGVKL